MALKKLFPRTDSKNTSGLDLSYHMIGFLVIDKKEQRCAVRVLSFVDKIQRTTSIKGGYDTMQPYIFTEKEFNHIAGAPNKEEIIYGYLKKSLLNKDKKETNPLADATNDK